MNTNTNKNTVNKPEGAKRPINPNQTVEEQKHNAQINNINNNMEDDNMLNNNVNLNDYKEIETQVDEDEEELDCSSDCDDEIYEDETPIENNNTNKNNKEAIVMEKIYTNKIEGTIETVSALYNEIFMTVISHEMQVKGIAFSTPEETEEYVQSRAKLTMKQANNIATIYFNINKIHSYYHTPLAVAIKTRMKNNNYEAFTCSYSDGQEWTKAIDKENKPATGLKPVSYKTVFRKPVWNHNLRKFLDRYAITKDITTYVVFPFETSTVEGKSEVIIFNLVPERKTKLESELKTATTARKVTEVGTKAIENLNTTVSVLAEETVPVVMDAAGKLTVNTVGAVVEGARAFTTSVARETLNYIYTHRDAQSLFGQDTINAWNRVKGVWDERKAMKNNSEDECY